MFNRIKSALETRARREDSEKGFTLIELLVVVLIIGILSAIAIPIFIGQQDQARDAAAKSDLANAKVAIVSYMTDNDGTWPAPGEMDGLTFGDYGYNNTAGVGPVTIISAADLTGVCLSALSGTGKTWYITDKTGASETACT